MSPADSRPRTPTTSSAAEQSAGQDVRPVGELSYEQARDELVQLVARIESGQVPLEEAMLLWERGEALAAHCQTKLDAAQDTLDRATGAGVPAGGQDDQGEAEPDDDDPGQDPADDGADLGDSDADDDTGA